MEDSGTWFLRLLWRIPQPPKEKIKLFIRFGDHYSAAKKYALSRFCYGKAHDLAASVGAVHYLKKMQSKFDHVNRV